MDNPFIDSESAGVNGPQCDDAADEGAEREDAMDSAGEKILEAMDSAGETRLFCMKVDSRGMVSECSGMPVALPCTFDWLSKWKVWKES